jgi:hypothetical protein
LKLREEYKEIISAHKKDKYENGYKNKIVFFFFVAILMIVQD